MKKLFMLFILVALSACAPKVPTCTMNWSCGNSSCAYSEGAWSGSGTFTGNNAESDCLGWETLFLNCGYSCYGNRVSSCSCS